MKLTTCSTCGAPIFWRRTAAGKRMPIDADPAAGGNIILDADGVTCSVQPGLFAQAEGKPRYQSHFVTCPDSAQHRRTR